MKEIEETRRDQAIERYVSEIANNTTPTELPSKVANDIAEKLEAVATVLRLGGREFYGITFHAAWLPNKTENNPNGDAIETFQQAGKLGGLMVGVVRQAGIIREFLDGNPEGAEDILTATGLKITIEDKENG